MRPELTLYHYWRSSCSWRVRWALALKHVPYESVPVNILKNEHQSPEYLKKNPAGFLPALKVGDRCFGESLALIEYIDETWPEPALWPKDPLARMHARQLALTIVAGTQPLQNPSLIKHFVPEEGARKPHVQHWIKRGLGVYESLLEQGPVKPGKFSCGEQVTGADLCLIPQVYNALRFDVDLAATPLVKGIYERCLETAECDVAAPHNQPGAQA